MAKGKHAAALFEVIHSGKPSRMQYAPRQRRGSWLGRVIHSTGSQVAAAGTAFRGATHVLALRSNPAARPAKPPKSSRPGVDMSVDSERQLINFRLTYHTAIVAGFAVLVLLGLSYAVGLKMTHGPVAATSSPSSADLRARGAHPDVLNVADRKDAHADLLVDNHTDAPPVMMATRHNGDQNSSKSDPGNNVAETDDTPKTPQRVIGLQYVIVQTFSDQATARAAKAFMDKNKIDCTIENGLAGWAPKTKFCLTGTLGFDHLRGNAEFDRYEANLTRLGDLFAEQNKSRHFEPRAYRWKGTPAI